MIQLKNTNDKRFKKSGLKEMSLETISVLPYKDGCLQYVFKPVELNLNWIAHNNNTKNK